MLLLKGTAIFILCKKLLNEDYPQVNPNLPVMNLNAGSASDPIILILLKMGNVTP